MTKTLANLFTHTHTSLGYVVGNITTGYDKKQWLPMAPIHYFLSVADGLRNQGSAPASKLASNS